ncbi:MAG: SDR family oxidoreductase [Porphyrobacter sp.]|nr:SDR family oxidoreductase [Porphyrobacter sp.]
MNDSPNTGQSVLVTGGARGIGAATTRLLAESGFNVLIGDVRSDEGERLAEELGDRTAYCHLDVTNTESWVSAVATAERLFGRVDGLFNNAGILGLGSVMECKPEVFRKILDVNLVGIFLGIRAVVPALRRAKGGVIVNTSSIAGLQGYANLAAYVTSKWGIRGLTKAAALDLARDRIRVVSIHPGPIHTPMTRNFPAGVAAGQPLPRFGEPIEVARMVRFLFSEASYSTGCEFVIDGGATAGAVLELEPELPGMAVTSIAATLPART